MSPRNVWPRKIVAILVLIILGPAAAVATLYIEQRALLYFPSRDVGTPGASGLGSADVVELKTRDGVTLSGWYLKGRNDKIILYFHGNGGNIATRAYRFEDLNERGFSVLAIDYRGYGNSTGTPTEAGLHIDADAAYDFAIARGFKGSRIILFGESLGSGVALELASRRPVAGIILDSPYSSVVDVAAGRFPFLPVRLLMWDQFRSDLWIKSIKVPMLIVHGTEDAVIPIAFARKLAALGGPNVSYVEVPEAGHLAWDDVSDDSRVDVWLQRLGSD